MVSGVVASGFGRRPAKKKKKGKRKKRKRARGGRDDETRVT